MWSITKTLSVAKECTQIFIFQTNKPGKQNAILESFCCKAQKSKYKLSSSLTGFHIKMEDLVF